MKKILSVFLAILFSAALSAQAVYLDDAIAGAVQKIDDKLPESTKIVVLSFKSSSPKMADYVLEEMVCAFVDSGKLEVIERKNLDVLKDEMKFQLSGDVSDESAQSIGQILGAKVVVTGSFDDAFRFRVKAIDVETARLLAVSSFDIAKNNRTDFLLGKTDELQNVPSSAPATPQKQTATGAKTGQNPDLVTAVPWMEAHTSDGGQSTVCTTTIAPEDLGGETNDVLTIKGKLDHGSYYARASAESWPDQTQRERIQPVKGYRFKALGDGKNWRFMIQTSDGKEYGRFEKTFSTAKGSIVEVFIPLADLKYTYNSGNKKNYVPSEIQGLLFFREGNIAESFTLKVFDFTTY